MNDIILSINEIKEDITVIIISALALPAVSLLWNFPELVLLILISISIALLYIRNTWEHTLLYLVAAVAGSIAEIIAIFFDAWTYSNPEILGIPLWLLPLWGIAALFIEAKMNILKKTDL